MKLKKKNRTIRGIESFGYEKDIMKIEFEPDYGLALGKILNIPVCVIIARSVFEENGKYYPQVPLKNCFFLSMTTKTKMIFMFVVKLL